MDVEEAEDLKQMQKTLAYKKQQMLNKKDKENGKANNNQFVSGINLQGLPQVTKQVKNAKFVIINEEKLINSPPEKGRESPILPLN